VRHVARLGYGDSLPSEQRVEGLVPVYGSNGRVGWHEAANTVGPTIVVGRKGSHGRLQFSPEPLFAIDTTYFIDRRMTSQDIRWLYYALQTAQLEKLSQDVGVPGLNREDAYAQRVPLAGRTEQRAIADFLDTETARIDALITKKRRMIDLLAERTSHLRSQAFSNLGRWRLKRVLRAPMAYGVLVPRFVDPDEGGVPMARIGALEPDGTIASDRLAYIDAEQGYEYRRTQTAAGDLLLSVVGSMGRSAVVDASVAGTNTNRPLARLQPVHQLPPRLLWHWTRTELFLDQARLATGGDTAQPTLNLGSLAAFDTGLPYDTASWAAVLDDLERELEPMEGISKRLHAQIALLQEHRQALITGAVTGELDVPGVAA
jgi:type I restriction enzyme S subunit